MNRDIIDATHLESSTRLDGREGTGDADGEHKGRKHATFAALHLEVEAESESRVEQGRKTEGLPHVDKENVVDTELQC